MNVFAVRVREFSKLQPEFRELRRMLLRIGGEEAAPPLSPDPMIPFLIDSGIIFGGPVMLKRRKGEEPLALLARAWRQRSHGIAGIGLGYALEERGVWREHTFGILREGVLETDAIKQKYFGLMLIGEAADGFSAGVLRDKRSAAKDDVPLHEM